MKQRIVLAVLFAMVFVMAGTVQGYYWALKPEMATVTTSGDTTIFHIPPGMYEYSCHFENLFGEPYASNKYKFIGTGRRPEDTVLYSEYKHASFSVVQDSVWVENLFVAKKGNPGGQTVWIGADERGYFNARNCLFSGGPGGNGFWGENLNPAQLNIDKCAIFDSDIGVGSKSGAIIDNTVFLDVNFPVVSEGWPERPSEVDFCCFFGEEILPIFVKQNTSNILVDPRITSPDTTGGKEYNFRLLPGSPCIDRGDPAKRDPNGSRLDIGPDGGTDRALYTPFTLIVMTSTEIPFPVWVDNIESSLPDTLIGIRGREVSIRAPALFDNEEYQYILSPPFPSTVHVQNDTTVVLNYLARKKGKVNVNVGYGSYVIDPPPPFFVGESVVLSYAPLDTVAGQRVTFEGWKGAISSEEHDIAILVGEEEVTVTAIEQVEFLVTWASIPKSDRFGGEGWYKRGRRPGSDIQAPDSLVAEDTKFAFKRQWRVNGKTYGSGGNPNHFNRQVWEHLWVFALYDSVGVAVADSDSVAEESPADFNHDGEVNLQDFNHLAIVMLLYYAYDPNSPSWPGITVRPGIIDLVYDLDQDGRLGPGDMEVLISLLSFEDHEEVLKLIRVDRANVEEESSDIILPFSLSQNYPNPFNAETIVEYQLARATHVRLTIWNATGQPVMTLVDADQPAGNYGISWDGRDAYDQDIASGIYIVRLEAGKFTATRRITLIR